MLLFANILSLFGNVFFSLSSLFKKKNKIVIFQSICHVLNSISEFISKVRSVAVIVAIFVVLKYLPFLASDLSNSNTYSGLFLSSVKEFPL